MKIAVDTNVLISATFWAGDSEKIIQKVEDKEVELILSKDILKEYWKVLNYEEIQEKIKHKNLEIKRTVSKLIEISTIVEPTIKVCVVKEDPDDNIILECGKEGRVDKIISQDKHLLRIGEFDGIVIITPKEFLE